MNKQEHDILLEKYLNGTSNLKEEQLLREYSLQYNTFEKDWFSVCEQHNKKRIGLQSKIWQTIEEQENTKHRKKYIFWQAAAVCLLLIGSIWQFKKHKKLENQKLAVLEEAIMVLSENVKSDAPQIIYEDDLIVLYSE